MNSDVNDLIFALSSSSLKPFSVNAQNSLILFKVIIFNSNRYWIH